MQSAVHDDTHLTLPCIHAVLLAAVVVQQYHFRLEHMLVQALLTAGMLQNSDPVDPVDPPLP